MPLIPTTLINGIKSAMSQPTDNRSDAAQRWADAYDKYAKGAMALFLLPTFTGNEVKLMKSTIEAVFAASAPSPIVFATAWATGVEAYWMAPPVVFAAGPAMGTPILFPGKAALIQGIMGALAVPAKEPSQAATTMATAVDAATRTVMVSYFIPPLISGMAPLA